MQKHLIKSTMILSVFIYTVSTNAVGRYEEALRAEISNGCPNLICNVFQRSLHIPAHSVPSSGLTIAGYDEYRRPILINSEGKYAVPDQWVPTERSCLRCREIWQFFTPSGPSVEWIGKYRSSDCPKVTSWFHSNPCKWVNGECAIGIESKNSEINTLVKRCGFFYTTDWALVLPALLAKARELDNAASNPNQTQ